MADLQLRSLGREVAQGDLDAVTRQIRMRMRAGDLPREHVMWAAHLGDPCARLIEEHPRILVECRFCHERRERYERDTRRFRQPLPVCLKCNNTTRTLLEKGLIKFVEQVDAVPLRLLIAWTCDCAEKQLARLSPRNLDAFSGRYRLPNQPLRDTTLGNIIEAARRWLDGAATDPLIFQVAAVSPTAVRSGTGRPSCYIARAVAQIDMEERNYELRQGLAKVVSDAWDCTRIERDWQEQCLIQYLLG